MSETLRDVVMRVAVDVLTSAELAVWQLRYPAGDATGMSWRRIAAALDVAPSTAWDAHERAAKRLADDPRVITLVRAGRR